MIIHRNKKNKLLITFKLTSRLSLAGENYIRCVVRVNGTIVEFRTGIKCLKSDWIGCKPTYVIKKNPKDTQKLADIVQELEKAANSIVQNGKLFTAQEIMVAFDANNGIVNTIHQKENVKSFENAKKAYLHKYSELFLANVVEKRTLEKYMSVLKIFTNYLIWQGLKVDNLAMSDITKKHILDLEFYLQTQRKYQTNTTRKYLKNLKGFFNFCFDNEWTENNAFRGYKIPSEIWKQPIFLTDEKVKRLKSFRFSNENLSQTRDMFLFQCYTGLAYVDFLHLKNGVHKIIEVKDDLNFKFWINGNRQKTTTIFKIPILSQAMEIINKYNGVANFPILTNQRYNFNLKQIQNILGFDEYLTTHVARKTCGFYLLNGGASYEIVASVLGHSDIRVTQKTYAKVLTKRISREVQAVKEQDTNIIIMPTMEELKQFKTK